ncbi:unnamed protein product (mitochondrion) [Plasmodiophora brassicae]|uniref:Tetraspanin n=2 Tax=Plasmodiophora brassicae TaxID=37360 RepID=A0A3P3Y5P5_PLABS|nr:unnamed protein product [Plasmodiophora brassicae]
MIVVHVAELALRRSLTAVSQMAMDCVKSAAYRDGSKLRVWREKFVQRDGFRHCAGSSGRARPPQWNPSPTLHRAASFGNLAVCARSVAISKKTSDTMVMLMKTPSGGFARDVYMLMNFLAALLAAGILYLGYLNLDEDEVQVLGQKLPEEYKDQSRTLMWLTIACSAVVFVLSTIALVGSMFRSRLTIKLGFCLALMMLVLEVAILCFAVYGGNDANEVAEKMWDRMPEDQRQALEQKWGCHGWNECRGKYYNELRKQHPKTLRNLAIVMVVFQALTIILGAIVTAKLKQRPANVQPAERVRYPAATTLV